MLKRALIFLFAAGLLGCQQPEFLPYFQKDPADCDVIAAPFQPESSAYVLSPHHVPAGYECVNILYGDVIKKVCGYDCKVSNGIAKCGDEPGQHCLVGSAGYIACGFDCKKSTITGEAQCGIRYGDRCFQAARGNIICGLNCHIENGRIICEKSPSFRLGFPLKSYGQYW